MSRKFQYSAFVINAVKQAAKEWSGITGYLTPYTENGWAAATMENSQWLSGDLKTLVIPPRSGPQAVVDNKWKTSLGAFQISAHLSRGNQSLKENPKEVVNYFGDDNFVQFVLMTYSQVKVKPDGTMYQSNIVAPSYFAVKSKSGDSFAEKSEDFRNKAKGLGNRNQGWGYGMFWNWAQTNTNDYTRYDEFLCWRLYPTILGGAYIHFNDLEKSQNATLQYAFYFHLKDKGSPKNWSSNERKLFLLMSGHFYPKNDLAYLNVMDANAGGFKYQLHGQPMVSWWERNFSEARSLESETDATAVNTVLKELLGEEPSLELFARHVSHGHTRGGAVAAVKSFAQMLKAYGAVARNPAILVNVSNDTVGPSGSISLAFPPQVQTSTPKRWFQDPPDNDFSVITEAQKGANKALFGKGWPKLDRSFKKIVGALGTKYQMDSLRAQNILDSGVAYVSSGGETEFSIQSGYKIGGYAASSVAIDWGTLSATTVEILDGVSGFGDGTPPQSRFLQSPVFGGGFLLTDEKESYLDYDPRKNFKALYQQLIKAVGKELSQGGLTTDRVFTFGEIATKKDDIIFGGLLEVAYAPLTHIIQVIEEEYILLQERIQKFTDAILSGLDTTAAKASTNVNIFPHPDSVEFALHLWNEGINITSRKVSAWLVELDNHVSSLIRYLVVWAMMKETADDDAISDALKKAGLDDPKVPIDTLPIAFDIVPIQKPQKKKPLTASQIKNILQERRKNIDQCLLSTNIDVIKKAYRKMIHKSLLPGTSVGTDIHNIHLDPKGNPKPFGGRFHILEHSKGDYAKIPNLVRTSSGTTVRSLLNIYPEIQSAMVPKLRLFRITTDKSNNDVETEFIFENFVSKVETEDLKNYNMITKGRGCGIKSFTWTYEGGTPATAKKDINAELVLYFQSFNELLRERGSTRKYKYIDLLLYPNNDNQNVHPEQYEPTNFRIRADVGWNIRKDKPFRRMLEARGIKYNHFEKALEANNKSLLLNMIDHDIDFKNDGSVEVKITYAAYIESLTRQAKVNALTTPQIEYFRDQSNSNISELLAKGNCEQRQLNALKRLQANNHVAYVKAAQGSIQRRLILRGLQRKMLFNKRDVDEYLKEFATAPPKPINFFSIAMDPKKPEKDQILVNFYMMGDIIHTVMDCLYTVDSKLGSDYDPEAENVKQYNTRRKELKNYMLLLSSFIYSDYNSDQPVFAANIADIPVSAKYFNEFLVNTIVKNERTIYPLLDFIKDLMQAIVDLMTDACINRQLDVSLMFQTQQIMAQPTNGGGETFESIRTKRSNLIDEKNSGPGDEKRNVSIIVDKEYTGNIELPLKQGDERQGKRIPVDKMYHYGLIYAVAGSLSAGHQGRGIKVKDEKTGVYHFQIGSNKGLLNNVKFAKTDMAYLREARYYNQGNYGLLQLGAVYNVELELFGNSLFYPGMEIFIDPRSFGTSMDPTKRSPWNPTVGGAGRSIANALGIGGYHIITKVNNTISTTGFKTTLSAIFQYSGDGDSRLTSIDGKTFRTRQEEDLSKKTSSRSTKCVSAVEQSLEHSIRLNKIMKQIDKNKKKKKP